jgi:hypothetical protein
MCGLSFVLCISKIITKLHSRIWMALRVIKIPSCNNYGLRSNKMIVVDFRSATER